MNRRTVYAAVGVAGAAAAALLFRGVQREREAMEDLARAEARRQRLDPDLVVAVMRAESGGNPRAVSPRDAYGLMQLRLPTARETAGRAVQAHELFDPRLNLELGCRYLARLLRRYGGDARLALMAYNAGPGNVDRWLEEDPNPSRVLESLAFPETRAYVAKILGPTGG